MADAGSSIDVAKAIGDPLATLGALLNAVTPEGPVQTALFLVLGLCVAAAPFVFRYYIGVLGQGAQPEGSLERKDYDALRASLAGGNLAARLYAGRLTRFLDAVDRFFGDAGMADRSACRSRPSLVGSCGWPRGRPRISGWRRIRCLRQSSARLWNTEQRAARWFGLANARQKRQSQPRNLVIEWMSAKSRGPHGATYRSLRTGDPCSCDLL